MRLLSKQENFDGARRILAAAIHDSRKPLRSIISFRSKKLLRPKPTASLPAESEQPRLNETEGRPGLTCSVEGDNAAEILSGYDPSDAQDDTRAAAPSPSKWCALRGIVQEGTLQKINVSVLEKWKMVVLEKWDLEKWVRGDGRHSWTMAENETSMIFQHIRTGTTVHFAKDSNGWIDIRYFSKKEIECVMCCSRGQHKPSALGPRCTLSMQEAKRIQKVQRFVKANDFELGAWTAQYYNGRWQMSNAHDPAVWIVLGEPGACFV